MRAAGFRGSPMKSSGRLTSLSSLPPPREQVVPYVILIVDDDEADRRALCRALRKASVAFEVHEASNVNQALELFSDLSIDCLLLDQHLPGCSGLELLRRLGEGGPLISTPVIMITGDDSQRLGVSAMRLGIADLVSKGELEALDLPALVQAVIDLRDKRREEARRLYAEKLATLGQLVSGAAHEINNPAAIVRLALSAVADALTDLDRRAPFPAPLEGMEDGTEPLSFEPVEKPTVPFQLERSKLVRLRQLVGSADQALGRIGLVLRELENQTGSALGHVQDLSFSHAVEFAQPRIDLRSPRPDAVRYRLTSQTKFRGDVGQLARVVVDLVDNALEAVGPNGTVDICTERQGDFVDLIVDDDGPGIENDSRDRVFEPLFTTRRHRGALGMGLARASAIVERHGGTINAERSPLGGARFIVRIPVQAPEEPPSTVQPRTSISGRSGVRPRVLVVDDEPQIRDSYRRVLRTRFDVDVASSGVEASEMVELTSYDAILCDVIMPGKDGVAFARDLSTYRPEQAAALMFCTGGVLEPNQERFLSSWGNGYLRKPLSAQELIDSLSKFIVARAAMG